MTQQAEKVDLKMLNGGVDEVKTVAVRILPKVEITARGNTLIFDSPSSIEEAASYLMQLYAEEDYSLRQFSIKMSKDKEDNVTINKSSSFKY